MVIGMIKMILSMKLCKQWKCVSENEQTKPNTTKAY